MNVSSWLTNNSAGGHSATKNSAHSTAESFAHSADAPLDRLDAELIVARTLQKDRSFLPAHPDYEFSPQELAQIEAWATRRRAGEPLAYIFGEKAFYGRDFIVTPATLIPRPETEALIDLAKTFQPRTILDVGTGSGCIAVTLALELSQATVSAVDISSAALKVATKNAQKLGATVHFAQSDLLEHAQSYDLIVANLPYVDCDWSWLSPELKFEPATALYADDGGLALIKQIIQQAPAHLNRQGRLLLEADLSQHQKIADFAAANSFRVLPSDPQNLALCLALSD